MAPPGSGKTRVLQERAAYLLERDKTDRRIIAVTFTADAAKELDGRIRRQCPDVGERVLCGTFHSLAKRQIEEAGLRIKLASDHQQTAFLNEAYNSTVNSQQKGLASFDEAVRYIEQMKSSVIEIAPKDDAPAKIQLLHGVYEAYDDMLATLGLMDFSDLIAVAVRGMRQGTKVHGDRFVSVKPLAGFHMLVDEVQDTDDLQLEWVRCHIEANMGLTAVGDDDQSIFSFRKAASLSGMMRLMELSRGEKIVLTESYRCAQVITAVAKNLIRKNVHREHKDTVTRNLAPGIIELRPAQHRDDEIKMMADIIKLSGERGNWAVLARNNWLLDEIERGLKGLGLNTARRGAKGFWEGELQQAYLGLLRSLTGGDMTGIDTALRLCGEGSNALEALHASVGSRSGGAMRRFVEGNDRPGVIGELQKMMRTWTARLKSNEVELVAHDVAAFLISRGQLIPKAKLAKLAPEERKKRYEGCKKVLTSCANAVAGRRGTLAMRIMGIDDAKERPNLNEFGEVEDVVTLMTMHSSKGLEFKNVWLAGCENGIVPSKRAPDQEEERRIFYVALTRAINRLVISRALSNAKPPKPGEEKEKKRKEDEQLTEWSPFLDEAGIHQVATSAPVFVAPPEEVKREAETELSAAQPAAAL